jgi:putative ABC transport system permease protein
MRFLEIFGDVFRSLAGIFAHRLRAALTLLGVAIGTGSIVLLASLIVAGKSFLLQSSQEASSSDVVQARAKAAPPKQRERTTHPLSRADAEALGASAALEGTLVAPERSQDKVAHVDGRDKTVALVSSSAQTLALYRLTIEHGRALDAGDERDGRRVVVVGHEVYEELLRSAPLDPARPLSFRVDDHELVVVGVLAHKPMMGSSSSTYAWDRKVLLPATTYDALYDTDHTVDRIYVRTPATSAERRESTRSTVRGLLERRHFGVLNFDLAADRSGGNEALILGIIQILLLGTGVLALVASGINIMNVMLVTVSERRREIGLRRAIGATPRSILVQFLIESGVLSLTGGVLGLLLGALVAWCVALVARSSLGHWELVIPTWSVAVGLFLALGTGLSFGILPAWRASRVSPIDALRAD